LSGTCPWRTRWSLFLTPQEVLEVQEVQGALVLGALVPGVGVGAAGGGVGATGGAGGPAGGAGGW